jgi:DNA-nicking Smr family endonuclease
MSKDDSYRPFKKLSKLKVKETKKEPRPKPEPIKARPDEDEGDAFARAMQGVKPIDSRGRDLPASKPRPAPPVHDSEEEAVREFRRFMAGQIDFDLESTEEFMLGRVRGLDSKIMRQLKAGAFSVEAHLDLHGLNADQAYDSMLFFLRESYLQGKRCVVLIPGRGKNSPGGLGVIKSEIQHWLTREPLKRVVLAFSTAQPRHGGAGALYVLLRKRKKSEGKVKWDKRHFWDDSQL